MDGGRGHGLLAGKVDGGLPALVGEVAVNLEVLADSFDDLKTDVVQSGATGGIGGGAGNVVCAARDKVLGGFWLRTPTWNHSSPLR